MNTDQILVVEDDDTIREELAELFGYDGYVVAQASNGAEALERLKSAASPRASSCSI